MTNTKENTSEYKSNLSKAIDNALQDPNSNFPYEVFPKTIQHLIENAYKTVGFNKDYFSAGILSICATAIGNTVNLDNGSYTSKPIFWVSIVGRTGTGKTHPLQFAKKPLEKKDSEAFLEYKQKKKEYDKNESDEKEAKPVYSKFLLNNFTPEKLAESLQYKEKGVLIFNDELLAWINSFGRYKDAGEQQMYLELFNGNELTVDRVTKEPIRIEKTNVNILGGMQPELLKGLAKNNRDSDGFLNRFLFVYPENLKPNIFTGLKIDSTLSDNYEVLINNLIDVPTQTIMASNTTIEIFKSWQHKKAKESFNDFLETAIQSKIETYVWRLALVLETMYQAEKGSYNTTLQEISLNNAIKLVEYFRYNILKVHDRIKETKTPLEELTPTQLDLYDSLPKKFKRIDVLPLFKKRNISIPTGDRFLKKRDLFLCYQTQKELKQGEYEKKIIKKQ